MINDQLLGYIRQQLTLNVQRDTIITNLKSQGWTEVDISEAFTKLSTQNISPGIPIPSSTISNQQLEQNPAQTNVIQASPKFLSKHFKKNKKLFLIITIFLLFCAISGGVYAYYTGLFLSLPKLTSKAIDNIRNTNSAAYDTTFSVDFSEIKDATNGINQLLSGGIAPTKTSLTVKGSYDFSDTKNKKISSNVSLNGGLFSTVLDFKVVDDTLFGEIIKAPTLSFLPVLAQYEGKWFSFPFKSENAQSLNNSLNPISGIVGTDSSIVNKITPEQKESLYQITRNANFIKTVKRFSPETISGELSYHFTFDLDREGINNYLKSLKEYVNSVGKDDSSLSAFDPTSFSQTLDKIQDFKGELWISRKEILPSKIILDFAVKPDSNKDEKIKVNIVSIFSAWNQPVSITAPAESTSFQEFISGVMNESLGQAKEKSADAAIKANLANIQPQAEAFRQNEKNNYYSGFCLSSELKTARKGIERAGGTEFICKDEKTKYAVEVKLTTNSDRFCIDSTNFTGVVKNTLTNTGCPKK